MNAEGLDVGVRRVARSDGALPARLRRGPLVLAAFLAGLFAAGASCASDIDLPRGIVFPLA